MKNKLNDKDDENDSNCRNCAYFINKIICPIRLNKKTKSSIHKIHEKGEKSKAE